MSDAKPDMERGLYIAATSMTSALARQDVIASNLANVNTVGFKADRVTTSAFDEMVIYNMESGEKLGNLSMGSRVSGTVTDFSQGALRNTELPTDVAIAGDGFFAVETPNGVRYTRNGQFGIDSAGYLVDSQSQYVLGSSGQRLLVNGDPKISPDGRVFSADGNLLGELGVFTLDTTTMQKIGANQWNGTPTGGRPGSTKVRQGYVEASGVNSIQEMVQMIENMRSYESSQRMVGMIDGTLDRAVNSLGTLG